MTLSFYQDRKKEWRWRLKARNGKIIAESGEGYKRKSSASRMSLSLFPRMPGVIKRIDPDGTIHFGPPLDP